MRTVLVLAALALASCVTPTPEVLDAARRGRDDAIRDVEAGRARVAWIGAEPDGGPLDTKTGEVRLSIGCCKSHALVAYRDAYNDVMDEARDAGRLPAGPFAAKATTRAVVEAMFDTARPEPITLGGAGLQSPGGRFVVEIAPGRMHEYAALWSTDRERSGRDELRFLGGDTARILFSRDGTTLFVRDDGARVYETIDLPARQLLQVFPDHVP